MANTTECQESGCSNIATKEWNGRKVCSDHYDKYRDEYDNMSSDLA